MQFLLPYYRRTSWSVSPRSWRLTYLYCCVAGTGTKIINSSYSTPPTHRDTVRSDRYVYTYIDRCVVGGCFVGGGGGRWGSIFKYFDPLPSELVAWSRGWTSITNVSWGKGIISILTVPQVYFAAYSISILMPGVEFFWVFSFLTKNILKFPLFLAKTVVIQIKLICQRRLVELVMIWILRFTT